MRCLSSLFAILILAIASSALSAPAPQPRQRPAGGDTVVLDTSHGKITFKLFPQKAPASVANFLRYVDAHFYDGTVFHRVVPNFVIQGGGMDADLTERQGKPPVKNEAGNGLSNRRGTVAVARKADPDSGTSQFYINLKDNAYLDRPLQNGAAGYCVFGEVIDGMDVVDRIAREPTRQQGVHSGVPARPVVVRSIRRGRR